MPLRLLLPKWCKLVRLDRRGALVDAVNSLIIEVSSPVIDSTSTVNAIDETSGVAMVASLIISDPAVMMGKPVVAGTRITVN